MRLEASDLIDSQKYREKGETRDEKIYRMSAALSDTETHRLKLKDIFKNNRYLPAGRIQSAAGASRITTLFNCFVSGTIEDDFDDIMDKLKEAGQTMRKGGGIGYDFSTLRPNGDIIRSLDSTSSGPVSFMGVYDGLCSTILSAGHRRGAQMGVMRVDHPDIEKFINAKQNSTSLTNFNVSVAVTDEFMQAVKEGKSFTHTFDGRPYHTVDARNLWNKIMRSTWDWAEPGVLFIDTINKKNPLNYCETIAATNPCGEQPLPPYGACLLGSYNLVAYIKVDGVGKHYFDYTQLSNDVYWVTRAMDNAIDIAIFPLERQAEEARNKRRMGQGITGLANAGEILGLPYGTESMREFTEKVLKTILHSAYDSSALLSYEKGPFPLFDKNKYCNEDTFFGTLPSELQDKIYSIGLRNSHLTSIAPTGTISFVADNISSGIEPPFSMEYDRDIFLEDGEKRTFRMRDHALEFYGVRGRTADEISVEEHVDMLTLASKYVDSSVSKTCNVGDNVPFERFKEAYVRAYDGGASGCTTFRASGKRFGVLRKVEEPTEVYESDGAACYIDPDTGKRECE